MPTDRSPTTARRALNAAGLVLGAAVAAVGVATGAGALRAKHFEVTRRRRVVRGLEHPLRVALLTDLHLGPYLRPEHLRAWVEAANDAAPDVTLVGGDFVDSRFRGALGELGGELRCLRAPLGVYGVPGNHDYRAYPDLAPMRAALETAGVRLLVNEGAWLRDDAYLAGVDDELEGYPDLDRAMSGYGDASGARIVLAHSPDSFPAVGVTADLALAGHTHGGQVCLPLIGALATSSRYGRRFVSGWVQDDPPSFVSRGLGVTLLPVRLNCTAELALLELEPPPPA